MITVLKSRSELEDWRNNQKGTIGFVPTMGNLHQGHLSLIEKALFENKTALMSIYVNPTQFGPSDDFGRYPRTLENDLKLLHELHLKYPSQEVAVFAPLKKEDIYGENFQSFITVEHLDHILEGEKRPGHFKGVATVVYLLFQLSKPTKAYFGQKDYQQVLVIKKMAKDLLLPVEIISMPIIRDVDGLALSSRNQYLSTQERKAGLKLPETLNQLAAELKKNGRGPWLEERIKSITNQDSNWDYLLAKDAENLQSISNKTSSIVLLAVYRQGTTRLLDNQVIDLT